MQEELFQFKRNKLWELVPILEDVNAIGTKWVFKNKYIESGNVKRNQAKLVAQGYTQIKGMDFDETYAPVAILESIGLLLDISCMMKFRLFQMGVKNYFLNWYFNKEVYV